MRIATVSLLLFALTCAGACYAGLDIQDNGKALTVVDGDTPVLTYRYTRVDPPEGVDADRFWRMSYIHPLYGLDGDVLTEDFPRDHYHHRGVFWTWPRCAVGDKRMDTWAITEVRQLFDKWVVQEVQPDRVHVGVENVWKFDDDPDPKVRERISFTVHPADETGRSIDFVLEFHNVTDEVVTFLGATEIDKKAGKGKSKGYGGFCIRPDKDRKPFTFTTAQGALGDEVLWLETPWADMSSKISPDGPSSGVAIFQHPKTPGFPHPGWIFRYYGFLGASWPHNEPYTLDPGEFFILRYRLYIHRGTAEEARVADQFKAFLEQEK